MTDVGARTWECTINGTAGGQPVVNRFGVQDIDSSPMAGSVVALHVKTGWIDNILPVMSEKYVFEDVRVVNFASPPVEAMLDGDATEGGVAGEMSPGNVAVCASFRTGFSGGSFRGRMYLGGVPLSPGDPDDPNHLATDFLTNYQNAMEAWYQDLIDDDLQPIVISRYNKAAVPTPPHKRTTPILVGITSVSVNSRLDSQRRRLGRQ